MNLRKRVIESTIIAVMLTVVTAVTAVMQTAPVENVPEPQQETKAVVPVHFLRWLRRHYRRIGIIGRRGNRAGIH